MDKNRLLEEHLQILNQLKEVETDQFFFTRLKAKMEAKNAKPSWLLPVKPVWVLGTLIVFVVLNSFVLTQVWNEQRSVKTGTIQDFASTYGQTIATPY